MTNEVIAALIGALVGAGATGLVSLGVIVFQNRHAARLQASARLRAAFAPAMADMRTLPAARRETMLTEAFPAQSAAIEEFRAWVPACQREAFERTWRAYWEVAQSPRFFDYYMKPNGQETFFQRVEAVLAFSS